MKKSSKKSKRNSMYSKNYETITVCGCFKRLALTTEKKVILERARKEIPEWLREDLTTKLNE